MGMRAFVYVLVLAASAVSGAAGASLSDATGVVRVFGDASNWMSSCFVIGDGSWIVTTHDAVTEKVGPGVEQTIRHPIFISAYTGQAFQCELKGSDKDLNVALLKLPVKGLPAAPFAQPAEFAKAAFGTMGQLMSGDPVGNRWPTEIYGITREQEGGAYKLAVAEWSAKKTFVTEIGKHKWMFVSEQSPLKPAPNGSIVARGPVVVAMYINKLVITGGKEDAIFGRCAMSTEIARFANKHGIETATLYDPPAPTISREEGADAAFQLRATIYSLIGAGRAALAVEPAIALAGLRPKEAEAHMVMGVALMGAGKFDEALKAFGEAARLDPKLPNLRMNHALALVGASRPVEAEAELLKAIEESPGNVRPVTALADFYLADEKTYDKALSYANKATAMAPNSPAALLLMARAEKRLKNYDAAIKSISEAIKMAPAWSAPWYAIGSTYEEGGDKANAEKAYRKLVEMEPKNPTPMLTLASFFADNNRTGEAMETIGKIRELSPPQEVLDAAQTLEDKVKNPDGAEEGKS